jgi:heme/copper-type cytochrome/quinol oxidase subunit 1
MIELCNQREKVMLHLARTVDNAVGLGGFIPGGKIMRGPAFWFFCSAAAYVAAGMAFGIYMAISGDHTLSPVHGHLNLVGWVTMAIFGLFYHLVPHAAETRLARAHFAVATIGLWLMVPGIALAIRGATEAFAALGSLFSLASMLIFLFVVVRSHRRVA